jgi:hypothetical protein
MGIPGQATLRLFLLFWLLASSAEAEVVARCGKGWLERVDGYPVLHLRGDPYEIGYQHGALLRDDIRAGISFLLDEKQHEATIEVLGRKLTPEDAIRTICRLQRPFTPRRYLEEMRGLADGAEVDLDRVQVANAIPELFHCTGFALLEEVTEEGELLHGRVLDYGVDWRLQEHAVLVVAEPDGRVPFANVTYAGFIGSVTGMNRAGISLGEMGGRGLGQWLGTPMAFLMRRALEEAETLEEAIAVFRESRRTCEYYYVVADGSANRAVGVDGSALRFGLIRPGEAHDRLPSPVPHTVLLSAGSRYRHLVRKVRGALADGGRFDVEEAIRLMDAPVAMKSNLHNVLMAPKSGRIWIANAAPDGKAAWTQTYRSLDLGALLARDPGEAGRTLAAPPARGRGK